LLRPKTRSLGGITLARTIIFQGGFFTGITILCLVIQALLPHELEELRSFVAAFIDRLVIIAVFNTFFVEEERGSSTSVESSSSLSFIDENKEDKTGCASSDEGAHSYIMIV
jgi:hypothetical protein